jgi:hypothetical protein
MITDALSISEKVAKVGSTTTLAILCVLMMVLSLAVGSLMLSQPDKRLAVVETRIAEIDKKLDKMDASSEARFNRLEAKLDRALER